MLNFLECDDYSAQYPICTNKIPAFTGLHLYGYVYLHHQ